MGFLFGRMAMDSPLDWAEQMGDPVTNVGGAPVPAVRSALRHAVGIPTFTSPIEEDTVARRMRLRRQLRSFLNNTAYKMQGAFLIWDEDPEQNGWYIPDQGQLAAGADSPLTHGFFKLENFVWFKGGSPRTHRSAVGLYLKDTRTGEWARDILKRVYSTDFAALLAPSLTYLPAGAQDVIDAVKLNPVGQLSTNIRKLPPGRDGGQTVVIANGTIEPFLDLGVLSFELPESERNKGDVVVYDQRGIGGLPIEGEDPQDFGWEEVYGPDYPVTSGSVPVLDNGFVRVVYDPTHLPGFKIYTWNGTKYVEQGKVNCANEILQSANVKEYTPERAVIEAVFTVTGGNQRSTVFITLQRGWRGPRFEVYGSSELRQAVSWTWSAIGTNTTFAKIDSVVFGGVLKATAGTGSTHMAGGTLGAAPFPATADNCILSLVQGVPGSMQLNAAVVIANTSVGCGFSETVTGVPANGFSASELSTATLYASLHLGFSLQQVDQIMEAENMALASGTTSVVDAEASEGKAAKGTRTSEALHVSRAEWPNKYSGIYRVFARVRATGGKLNIRAGVGGGYNATQTNSSPTYVWMDLGDAHAFPVSPLEIRMWGSAGPGAFPSPAATDTFKRTAESPLSNAAKWSTITGAANTGNISSEEWHAESFPTISGARWNVAEQTNPAVSLEVTALPNSSERYIGVWACLAAAAKSGYFARWEEESTPGHFKVTIERWVTGTKTVLTTLTGQVLEAKDSIGIAVRGGVIGAYRKHGGVWTALGTGEDATFTKGYTGIEGSGSNGGYNNFAFSEVPAGTPEFWLDRIEAFLMEDAGENPFTGGRDLSRSVLIDSRVNPTVVTRS